MKFGIVVNEGPYTHQASDTAWNFCVAALNAGHEIVRIFFYQDGVNNASRLGIPPQDERDISGRWSALGKQYHLDLVVCVAAAQRRGLLDENEARRAGKDADNMAPAFNMSGLGQLIDAGVQADRLLVFGD